MKITTETIIDASVEQVWKVLTNFERYSQWNPFILKIEGHKAVGSRLRVEIVHSGNKTMVFKPLLLRCTELTEFRWVGILGTCWLFSGEHYFILEGIGKERTRLTHGETFKGLLSPIFSLFSGKQTKQGFEAMNNPLKVAAET